MTDHQPLSPDERRQAILALTHRAKRLELAGPLNKGAADLCRSALAKLWVAP